MINNFDFSTDPTLSNEIIRLYTSEKCSMIEITERLRLSYALVRNHLISNGIHIREHGRGYTLLTDSQVSELINMYLSGYTSRMLSEKFGITIKRVEKYLSKHGIRKKDRRVIIS